MESISTAWLSPSSKTSMILWGHLCGLSKAQKSQEHVRLNFNRFYITQKLCHLIPILNATHYHFYCRFNSGIQPHLYNYTGLGFFFFKKRIIKHSYKKVKHLFPSWSKTRECIFVHIHFVFFCWNAGKGRNTVLPGLDCYWEFFAVL